MSATSPPPGRRRFALAGEADTQRLGRALGHAIESLAAPIEASGLVVTLSGDLGTGKTTLVRAALRRLGVSGPVKSPTFSLLELYPLSRLNFHHFDFYRFSDPAEFESAGFRDYFGAASICAIEWPERAGERNFRTDLRVRLQLDGEGRVAEAEALTALGQQCLQIACRDWEAG